MKTSFFKVTVLTWGLHKKEDFRKERKTPPDIMTKEHSADLQEAKLES